ncbi:Cyclic nucleotide-binding domain-containing protein [Catalinimonas alkaloidigena]|uniref:Cyclic nucleotide-binding domain-containing protein n=1 Tax=Catalinimonas alkaloidigena TaxID=1075417 RepID=A0A1G8WN61_9BACT|nr:cyclic nucleotide-binding domain-containing protein [Catalinimonas alkaloidigena]SDJ79080.1 Cyclic nucleotide-binding domain-containing protein [Catalinimonas alkaloidigena]
MINPFRRSYTVEELNLFRFMRSNKLFAELNNEELMNFVPYLYLREYKKKEVVFFRGDPSQALYLIKSGTVSLFIDIDDKFETLTSLGTSQSFGDNALLYNTKRYYNAIVESEFCELYVIPQANLHEIFNANVKIRASMFAALAAQFNQLTINLFESYQASFGFFDLGQIYQRLS